MKIAAYKRTFVENPLEINLTLWISNCPRKCKNCQTPFLQEDTGEELTKEYLVSLIKTIGEHCTNVVFLGGEQHAKEFVELANATREEGKKVTLYTGADAVYPFIVDCVDYLKLGPYNESAGPLTSKTTNQTFWKVVDGEMENITSVFWENTFIEEA